jgi:hypothetical protein
MSREQLFGSPNSRLLRESDTIARVLGVLDFLPKFGYFIFQLAYPLLEIIQMPSYRWECRPQKS